MINTDSLNIEIWPSHILRLKMKETKKLKDFFLSFHTKISEDLCFSNEIFLKKEIIKIAN